jgi:hypothetical protein
MPMTCSLILDLPPVKERADKDVYALGDSGPPVAAKRTVISGTTKTSRSLRSRSNKTSHPFADFIADPPEN